MSVSGRNLRELGSARRDQLTSVLARTITGKPLVLVPVSSDIIQLSFRDSGLPSVAALGTKYGPMNLYVGQVCDVVADEDGGQWVLRTRSYRYTLQPQTMDDPLFRWEYIRFPATGSVYCRHHLQGSISFEIIDDRGEKQTLSLNEWHLPTGWAAIEEVLRFCIVDLEVRPLSNDWDQILRNSREDFETAFAHSGA